jgi:hypothetical protein
MKAKKPYHSLIFSITGLIIFFAVLACATDSWGYLHCVYNYEALIDIDNNTSTGGPVTVVQGDEAPHDINGIDYKVQVHLNICKHYEPNPELGPIEVIKWDGESFVLHDTIEKNYNIGIEQGGATTPPHYADVIEFGALKSSLGSPEGPMKIVYHASLAAINDYTTAFLYPKSTSGIPALSEWGLMILSVLIGFTAFYVMRRKKSVTAQLICGLLLVLSLSVIAWAIPCPSMMLDGQVDDWTCPNIQPAVSDPIGDSSPVPGWEPLTRDPGEDIVKGYITSNNDYIYFRIDIVGGEIPPV